jgi:superfamily I DNA/RNA helicase
VDRYGSDAVLVTSFSRAAAAELAGRDLPIAPDRVGTLHSHCWHALGGPEIAEANVEEWNHDHPHLAMSAQRKQGKLDGEEAGEDDDGHAKPGDQMLEQLNRYRGLMIPRTPLLAQFEGLWTEYKQANGLMDFTDLIEKALQDVFVAPGHPSVIFADEAQDLNRMQLKLVRKWGARAQYFIVAGDDDQTIYSFTGATPEAFLRPEIPLDHKIILKQSYRVPCAVHERAERLIHQIDATRRQDKVYLPRAAEGGVHLVAGNFKTPQEGVLPAVMRHLDAGKTVMLLAACSYMLRPLVMELRKHGIPFHNPYRTTNGFWNPIRTTRRTTTASRVLALLVGQPGFGPAHRPWTRGDLAAWADALQAKDVVISETR